MSLDILINQLEEAIDSKFYFLSLATALTIPDIAGAIASDDGVSIGQKYKDWYNKWVRPRFIINVEEVLRERGIHDIAKSTQQLDNPFDGEACYYYRCAMLHQARSTHSRITFSKVMFIEPKATSNVVHYGQINGALAIDLPSFCREVVQGYRDWVKAARGTENYERNIAQTVQRHKEGLLPYISGVPVIS